MHGFLHLNQTYFPVSNYMDAVLVKPAKNIRSGFCISLLLITAVILSACSTPPKITTKEITITPAEKNIITTKNAKEILGLAQSINSKLASSSPQTLLQQTKIITLLIEASELYLQQHNYTEALWLASQTAELVTGDVENSYRLLLVKASSLYALNYNKQAQQQLALTEQLVALTQTNISFQALELTLDYYLLLSKILSAQNKPVLAIAAQLQAFALNPEASTEDAFAIWHELQILAPWQLAQLVESQPPFIKGWQQLLLYSQKFGANTAQFSHYLQLWQQQNSTHPANSIIAQLQSTNAIVHSVEKPVEQVAILLPLSGNQKMAGLAAQQGVLAAYNDNSTTQLHFIDTHLLDWQTLATRVSELNIDHIIGPLLRDNVDEFLMLSQHEVALQVPTLLLNLSADYQLASYQVALSMRPEDEAEQAAETLSLRHYKNPIVLSHQDNISSRIAKAFTQQWQKSSGQPVDIVYFNQGKQMQTSLKSSLDINTSEMRIAQLNGRLKHNIKSEPRNRRDIDMIYLIGSDAQTRLIKPYIDVNTSPFADIIPVYASSRSHSSFNDKHHTNSTNDLQNLTFTQIPWLLQSSQQNKALVKLSDKLWPKRTDSLSRIFAMGYDSYNLLSTAFSMKELPYIRHFGQTGTLSLNNNNILTRSLIWGRYQDDKVMQVVLE